MRRINNIISFIIVLAFSLSILGCATIKGKGYEDITSRYFSKGNYAKAAEYGSKAVEYSPKNTGYLTMLGWSYFKLGNFDMAISTFEKLAELDPNIVDAYTGRGWSYFKKLDYDKAIVYFEQALGVDAESADAFDGIGWCSSKKNDLERSEMYFEIALAKGLKYKKGVKTKTDAEAHRGLGYLNFGKQDYKTALTHFKVAAINMPDWNDARIKWGDCLYALGDYKKAAGIYKHALKYEKTAELYDKAGWSYVKLNRYKPARDFFNKAVQINPLLDSSLLGLQEVEKNLVSKK